MSTLKTPGKVTVQLDKSGRRGKEVTMISGIQHNPQVIETIAKELKKLCGAGGTVYGKTIEVQGNHVTKISAHLTSQGFIVKN